MQWTKFQAQYPTISALLPSNFMADAQPENTLRRAIEHDRTDYLDILDNLAQKTPAKEIRKDPNRLTSKTNFQSLYTELKAYVALKHWVFAPHPEDVQGTQGEPDYEFNIGELDIEVAMSKVFTSQVTNEIMDLTVHCVGANGIGKDLPIAHFYENVRAFRIVDGADEVHLRSIARDAFEDVSKEEMKYICRFDEDRLHEDFKE